MTLTEDDLKLLKRLYEDIIDVPAISMGDGKWYRTIPEEWESRLRTLLRDLEKRTK